jgi:hypothetical protein
MALARIITHSHPCSRQLALDLIARGYAVEIVSPDSIPDNLADLELRVEEEPGNQLVASVEAHNGAHTASLEFLHYLKAPMPDFIRRPPPEPHEAVHLLEPTVSINVEQSAEEVKLPADAPQPASGTVSRAAKVLRDSKLDPEPKSDPDPEHGLILPRDTSPTPTADRANHIASASSVTAPSMPRPATSRPITTAPTAALPEDVRPLSKPRPSDQFPESFRNVAVAMALMLALVFGFGTRPSNKATAQSSGAASAALIANASVVREKNSGKPQGPPAATKPEGHPNDGSKESLVAKVNAPTAKAPSEAPTGVPTGVPTKPVETGVSIRHGDGLIARDTVTYLDKGAFDYAASRDKVSQSSTLAQPISRKHDGVIAENSVTVLNSNPAPKAAKPDSGIKRYSDLK